MREKETKLMKSVITDSETEEHYTVTYYTFNGACSAHTGKEYFLLLKSSSS